MTGQLLFMAAMGVLLGVCGGYPWGRVLRRRERNAAEWRGYDLGFDAGRYGIVPSDDVLRPAPGPDEGHLTTGHGTEYRGGLPSLAGGPPHPGWREQTAAELAPEALALENVPEPWLGSGSQGDEPGSGDHARDAAGLGHPSPYAGVLTPAQRRRDKHKQRGQYAPAPGWSPDPEHVLAAHWKPEGDRWMAEWRIEWQDDVAAVDEEIAGWVERQRLWLAADRWDRGARRLGAVA